MGITLRPFGPADADVCAAIVHEAFREVAVRHGFVPAFESFAEAEHVVRLFLGIAAIRGTVAEVDGRPAGVIFLDEGDEIRAIAIVAVAPGAQGLGLGRRLLGWALDRAGGAAGVRLVHETYNVHALGLYASLGFEVKEPLARMVGRPRTVATADAGVRRLAPGKLDACAALYREVHGIDRSEDLRDAFRLFDVYGLERGGRLTACTYAFSPGGLAWGVAREESGMRALLGGVAALRPAPIGFLLPTRQASLLRWCLDEGMRAEKPLTLMARGAYQEPRGGWFPSGFY